MSADTRTGSTVYLIAVVVTIMALSAAGVTPGWVLLIGFAGPGLAVLAVALFLMAVDAFGRLFGHKPDPYSLAANTNHPFHRPTDPYSFRSSTLPAHHHELGRRLQPPSDPSGQPEPAITAVPDLSDVLRSSASVAQSPARLPHTNIDAMSGAEFEAFVAAVLRDNGYTVETTKTTGDFGVDLIAQRGLERVAVQCKRYGKPVSGAAVQQAVTGAAVYDCNASMVVANQSFTPAAVELAKRNNCRLVDRAVLLRLAAAWRQRRNGRDGPVLNVARRGKWERAELLAAASADSAECYQDLAWLRAEQGSLDDAERLANEALRRGNPWGLVELANTFRHVGRLDDAERVLAIPDDAGYPAQPSESWSLLRAHQGRWEEAERLARLADRDNYLTWVHLIELRIEQDDWDEAEQLARRSENPGFMLDDLSWRRAVKHEWAEAERLADAAAAHGTSVMQEFLDSASDYEELGRRVDGQW